MFEVMENHRFMDWLAEELDLRSFDLDVTDFPGEVRDKILDRAVEWIDETTEVRDDA